MICPRCGTENLDRAKLCNKCGSPLRLGGSESDTPEARDQAFSRDPSDKPLSTSSIPICAVHASPCLLDTVLRVGACLTQTMDVDHFLDVATAELVKSMEVEAVGILLYDDRLSDFYWREGLDRNRILIRGGSDGEIRIDRTAIDRTFQTGKPFVIGDAAAVSAPQTDLGASADPVIYNALIVPLNTREKTIGVLVLANKKPGRFTERDIDVSVSLAGVLAMAIENADFFEELIDSYRKVVAFERIKSKIVNRISHELKTPVAILQGSIRSMERRLRQLGIRDLDNALARLNRQVENLRRLEVQVESIMQRGYAEERQMLAGLLESAASLIEIQAEQTPEIKLTASLILRTVQQAFPANREQWMRINIKEFGQSVLESVRSGVARQGRQLTLLFDLKNGSDVLIPNQVLRATIEGLVRNAVGATPDEGTIAVRGRSNGDFYTLTIEDSGIGIPEDDWGLVFEGFYQVQETENYTSGRPYAFNAGGSGMDLFRIKTFSQIYGFGLYFRSRRCEHLSEALRECPGNVDRCPYCKSAQDCIDTGGTVFEVELPLAGDQGHTGNAAGARSG